MESDADLLAEDTDELSIAHRALRFAREIGLTILIVAVLWVGLGMWRAPSLPDAAPDFTLTDLSGAQTSLADLRGQTVVLNFWATWCGPCRYEIPTLNDFAANNPDVPVLGIAVDGTAQELRRAVATLEIEYPVLMIDAPTAAAYEVTTLPTTIVVGPDGRVNGSHAGIIVGPHLRLLARR